VSDEGRPTSVSAAAGAEPGRRAPNVVLMNCDDLGYGDLGCYGSSLHRTPALDRMADEGMRFTDFYMASPVCSPSRAALLTGCYPPRIGFGDFDGLPVLFPGHRLGLDPSEISIARMLHQAGYATKLVGKWHCGDQPEFLPTRHGFDSYYGLPYSNDMGIQALPPGSPPVAELLARFGIRLPLDDMPPLPLLDDETVIEEQPDQASLTARYVEASVRFIREHRARPFFLYLAHLYVHVPIYVQEGFLRRSANGRYGAAVESIDWAADVILRELVRLGLDDSTIVVFTSDNGSRGVDGGSNGPLRGAKGSTWEGGMRVPCIVRWPGRVPAGSVGTSMASSLDLYPTLARLCGGVVPSEPTIDGQDITSLLTEGDAAGSPRDEFLFYRGNDLEAVRHGRWKLHVAKGGQATTQLYDLVDDPGESTDVSEQHPAIVSDLEARAESARVELGDARLGRIGAGVRSVGVVDAPVPLTTFDPDHPYYLAEYDLTDRG